MTPTERSEAKARCLAESERGELLERCPWALAMIDEMEKRAERDGRLIESLTEAVEQLAALRSAGEARAIEDAMYWPHGEIQAEAAVRGALANWKKALGG